MKSYLRSGPVYQPLDVYDFVTLKDLVDIIHQKEISNSVRMKTISSISFHFLYQLEVCAKLDLTFMDNK